MTVKISPDSTSYPVLGALYAHYGDQDAPGEVKEGAYWLGWMVLNNLRDGRGRTDMTWLRKRGMDPDKFKRLVSPVPPQVSMIVIRNVVAGWEKIKVGDLS